MPQNNELKELKDLILFKLKNRGYWGRRLMNASDLSQGVPPEKKGAMMKAAEELFNEGFLKRERGRKKEFRYSLNPSKKQEIEERVKEYLKSKGTDFRIIR